MIKPAIEAILFDKDGTLFDFQATWAVWANGVIDALSGGDNVQAARLASAMHYDKDNLRFLPSSPIIACTNREAALIVAGVLPERHADDVEGFLAQSAAQAPLAPAVPLAPLLDDLIRQGIALGVMTNDAEMVAHTHLRAAGVADRFTFVAGFDSGFGAKPAPDPLLAFARAIGMDPARIAMVGDSTHDLIAGRAAGMVTLGVLTGTASEADLTFHADIVLPDIGHIPAWLAT